MEKVTRLPLGALATNCYIVYGEANKAVVIDPASSAEVLVMLEANNFTLDSIILTHGHFDHFSGAAQLKRQTGAAIYAPELDAEMFQSEDKSWARFMAGTSFQPITPDYTFADGARFNLCGISFCVMSAPGHTAGSCMLFCEELGAIFCGDVLFRGSVGRADGFSGSERQTMDTMRKINGISGDYTLYCGHGEQTTLEIEKRYNPYLQNC